MSEKNSETELKESDDRSSFFKVEVPDVLLGEDDVVEEEIPEVESEWHKVKGWYNVLSFYSKVFQFFVERIKEDESRFGWHIIVLSSVTSFITLFTLEPYGLSPEDDEYYDWGKNVCTSVLTVITTLIAAWIKKKSFVKRIQAIDKRIGRLEKFIGLLDYQFRLVPKDKREDYLEFISRLKDEQAELQIYSNLISPSEFAETVYIITKYNFSYIAGSWPWYDNSKRPRKNFAEQIVRNYDAQYSWKAYICQFSSCCCGESGSLDHNPLVSN